MNYLMWRQHRNQLVFATAALVALAAVLVPTGVHLESTYHADLVACRASGTCGDLSGSLFRNYGILFDVIGLTAAVPALFGAFWGAPLVASEIENGTLALAWSQTVTRRRWLAVKVGWVMAAAATWGAAISALVTWWSGPVNAVDQSRFSLGHFDTQGFVPVGYSVFAVALGIAAGVALRRLLPALAVTLGVFAGLRFLVDYEVRPHYLAPLHRFIALSGVKASGTASPWSLGSVIVTPSGTQSNGLRFTQEMVPAACRGTFGTSQLGRCLGNHGWRLLETYQPAGRFWAFQGIELGIYLVLAAALIAASFLLVQRRDA